MIVRFPENGRALMSTTSEENTSDARRVRWLSWITEVESDAGQWAESVGWPVHRKQKHMQERSIGAYEAGVLEIKTPAGHLIIEPVALDVIGAEARIDLYAWPSLHRVKLIRVDDNWRLRTDSGVDWPRPWSKETFLDLAQELTSAA